MAIDPIAYRTSEQQAKLGGGNQSPQNPTGFDPSKLKNADVNISKYGDDSSAKNYNNKELRGGQNSKYQGEGTKNTTIEYNKDATIDNLDPNYKYGEEAQMQNSAQSGYITSRNDQIASALYNAGTTSQDDVRKFLEGQKGFYNSNLNERENTVQSIWKRLGEIQTEQTAPKQPEEAPKEEQQTPEMNLENPEGGKIYGKFTGDDGKPVNGIDTYTSPDNIDVIMKQARESKFKALQGMSSYNIALSLNEGTTPYGIQAMRDLMEYDPAKYQEIQVELDKIQKGKQLNEIAETGDIKVNDITKSDTDVINNDIDEWTDSNSDERNYDDAKDTLIEKLQNSQTATSATERMQQINAQIAEVEQAISNLPNEAKKMFKGDVPQYIYDAFVSNRSQKYEAELNKLKSQYSNLTDLYKTELAQKQWEAEMELKQKQFDANMIQQNRQMSYQQAQLQLQQQAQNRQQAYQNKTLLLNSMKQIGNSWYVMDPATGTYTKMTDGTAQSAYENSVNLAIQTLNNSCPDGASGGQCEVFSDTFTYQTTGLKMEGKNGGATTVDEKIGYVNQYTPVIGSVAVYDYGIKDSKGINRGHTEVVTGYDPNTGIVTLRGSNKKGEEQVYTTTKKWSDMQTNLNSGGSFKGFWNPFLDMKQPEQDSNGGYSYFETPMRDVFKTAYDEAGTKDLKDDINNAEDSYAILNELKQGGYIEKVANSSNFQKVLQMIQDNKFKDGENVDLDAVSEYIRNNLKDEDLDYAMTRFRRLIEKKLRKESGAAISKTEWNSNFGMYFPSVGMSPQLVMKRLSALEKDTVPSQLPSTYRTQYIPLINAEEIKASETSGGRQI